MAKKDCSRCGRCCIVCTDIQLTREEVREGLYPKRRRNRSRGDDTHGWSKWIMMRGVVYEPELKREIFACIFWDSLTRECAIYEDRPVICRMFKCGDRKGPKVHRLWLAISRGKKKALCLSM